MEWFVEAEKWDDVRGGSGEGEEGGREREGEDCSRSSYHGCYEFVGRV